MLGMVLSALVLIVCGVLLSQKKHPLSQKIKALNPYLAKTLSIDESYDFIEKIRIITLELVQISQNNTALKPITNKLLGYILAIPRTNETAHHDDPLFLAAQQIESVKETAIDLQKYLKKHQQELVQLLTKRNFYGKHSESK